MEGEIEDLTPEQQDLVDAFVGFQLKLQSLVESNQEMFKLYSVSQIHIKYLQNEIIDAADVADGIAKQLEVVLRRSRKETGLNEF